jgi:branched-chain amino acid transport system ATP-binding protein
MIRLSVPHTWERINLLELREISCGYGALTVVSDMTIKINKGDIFALIGANGAGKTSTIMAIAGHVALKAGHILFESRDISNVPIKNRINLGISLAPEGRRLFSDMTVDENLSIGNYAFPKGQFYANREKVLEIFPRLRERIQNFAGSLSGGEQQMLAIGRAMMATPKLLIIDELSLGLMPKVIDLCYDAIQKLKAEGTTILLVEQNTTRALEVADRVCVLESGKDVWQGSAEEAKGDPELIEAYLGLHAS